MSSTETISQFIQRNLNELANEYDIPPQIIPQIAHLIDHYPNPDIRGAKTELKDALAKIIEDLRKRGALS
ncbi:MAG: hypothetical protein ACU84J_10875 [Gammaproteobacteria bacterium]